MSNYIYRTVRSLYHTIRWISNFFRNFLNYRKNFGDEYAKILAAEDIACHFKLSNKAIQIDKKNMYVKNYLKAILNDIITEYASRPSPQYDTNSVDRVWVFWWDGLENAPEIVKACIRSTYRAAGDLPVVLLNKHNYSDYITLPDEICRKHDDGIIGHAHFSDMIRLSLLAQYGGLWVDATVYFATKIPENIICKSFFTCKQSVVDALTPSHGLWAGWILGGTRDCPLFAFARDALISYWYQHDHVIDYLLMDYVFDIAYDFIPEIHRLVDSLEANNPDRHQLMCRLNSPYDPAFFDRDTWFYKLSYRYGLPKDKMMNGCQTFYTYILTEDVENES